MRFTIITPTLLRPSLKRLCDSIDRQTFTDWEHLVMIDTFDRDDDLLCSVEHPKRRVAFCARPHGDWANTCRRDAWPLATGDYLLYIDDDCYLADDEVFASLRFVTEPVLLFPLIYRGETSAPLPIEVGRTDTNQLMVKREIGRWPDLHIRETDGFFIERLTDEHDYAVYQERALVVYESDNRFA